MPANTKTSNRSAKFLLVVPILATILYAGYCRAKIRSIEPTLLTSANVEPDTSSPELDDSLSDADYVARALAKEKNVERAYQEKINRRTVALKLNPTSHFSKHARQLEDNLAEIGPDQVGLRSEMERSLEEAHDDAPRR